MRPKCCVLFVTITKSFVTDVAPINKSKSSTIFPSFLNLAFSSAYISKEEYIGIILNSFSNIFTFSKFSFELLLFAASNFIFAIVISEIKQFSFPADFIFSINEYLPFR